MFLHFRYIQETLNTNDTFSHLRIFIRGLIEIAGVESEAKGGFFYCRTISETAHVICSVFRGMALFARIVTGVFVRDYLLSRFLKSKTEITLKSCVVREIIIDSRINGG
jgi:hypothetical protein